ncbi:hypothetical protein M3Y95_01276400 [Aphelenchoides besseyi]|nr:hypothetical protein M3Y95_01276400 [Aphelenchoides besseyi]
MIKKEYKFSFAFNDNFGYKIVQKSVDDSNTRTRVTRLHVYNMDNGELCSFEANLQVNYWCTLNLVFTENVLVLHSRLHFPEKEEIKTYRIHLRKPSQLSELVWYARPLGFSLDHTRFGIGR